MLSLSFAKLVATPTETSWSQVYNAGNLFAALSLSKDEEMEDTSLSATGKDIFSNLSAEFFTLETKDLTSIKQAIHSSMQTIPENVEVNLSLAYFKENILYLFIYGTGEVLMKRGNKIGPLLKKPADGEKIASASGFLQSDDIIIIQTPQFAKDMSPETLSSALDLILPNDIAEALSPGMHEKDDGGQAAIIINYKDALKQDIDEPALYPREEVENEEPFLPPLVQKESEDMFMQEEEAPPSPPERKEDDDILADVIIRDENPAHKKSGFSMPKLVLPQAVGDFFHKYFRNSKFLRLNHRTRIFLSIAVILFAVLAASVFLTKKREEDTRTAQLFQSVYEPALNNYQDGLSVKSINKVFARDEFLKSQQMLKDGSEKFKKGSKEEKQITELLAKVEKELGGATGKAVQPKQIEIGENELLSIAVKTTDAKGLTKDDSGVYYVTGNAVVSVDGKGAKKDIIKNDDDWEKPLGMATYQGNMYVLDAENAVLKFTAGSSGFGKSNYFKTAPDTSTAADIAIDGSVWILFKDGSIAKYTRGTSDGYTVKSLDRPMKNPTKIVTDTDTEGVYVLDPANSRIVEFDKSGNFQDQYVADVLKSAKEMEVSETDGRITILSGGKFYEIPL
jgi:hypothetical protein